MLVFADGALPGGWQPEFVKLIQAARPARDRQLRAFSGVKNEDASVWLHLFREEKAQLLKNEKKEAEQFLAAWELKPRRYKTKFQRSLFSGPTARKDAEEAERTRWIHELSLLVSGTPTPMGKLLAEKPGNVSMLGGGLRASTLRSRVRVLKKFFLWLVLSQNVVYPRKQVLYTNYLKAKLSDPCNRGALKNTNAAFVFLDEVSGTDESQRPTSAELCQVIFRELLSTSWTASKASPEDADVDARSNRNPGGKH